MPPRPPLADTAKCEVTFTGPDSVVGTCIFYAKGTTDISGLTALGDIASAIQTGCGTTGNTICGLMNNQWHLTGIRTIDNSGSTENVAVIDLSVAGAKANQCLSPQCAVVLSWQIAAHYRGGHPRTYLPGVDSASIDTAGGKNITNALRLDYEAAGDALMTAISGASGTGSPYSMGTISYFSGGVERGTPLFRTYLDAVVGTRLCTQRRRLGKEPALIS